MSQTVAEAFILVVLVLVIIAYRESGERGVHSDVDSR